MARFEKVLGRLAAVLVILAATIFMSCNGGATKGGGNATGANEEYKVLGRGTVPDDDAISDARKLEKLLNENAKQGWKVRAAAMLSNNCIILRDRVV